jgi:hypothetical protein
MRTMMTAEQHLVSFDRHDRKRWPEAHGVSVNQSGTEPLAVASG